MNNLLKDKNLEVGDLVIVDADFYYDENDFLQEIDFLGSLFKVKEIKDNNEVVVIKLSNDESKSQVISFDESLLNYVEINALNLFRNYIINTTLDFPYNPDVKGEFLLAIKLFFAIDTFKDTEELLNSTNIFSNSSIYLNLSKIEGFNEARMDYTNIINLLHNQNKEELIKTYLSDDVFAFSNFDFDSDFDCLDNTIIKEAHSLCL